MPRYILRPVSDTKANWNEQPGPDSWANLDDAVDTNAAGDTGNYIQSSTDAQVTEVELSTFTLPGDEVVVGACAWMYADTPGGGTRTISLSLWETSAIIASTVFAGADYAWHKAAYEGALTQTQINDLSVQVTANIGAGSGNVKVATIFVEVLTHKLAGQALEAYQAAADANPGLLWIPESSGSVVPDHSGNFRHGDLTGNYAAASSLLSGGQASIDLENDVVSGARARDYKPFAAGSARTFMCLLNQESQYGAPTVFAGSGTDGSPGAPHPTWEFIDAGLIRFYGTVDTYPLTFDDLLIGNDLSETVLFFATFDDTTSIGHFYVNGQHVGTVGPKGYGSGGYDTGSDIHYDTGQDPGYFQVGYRGNGTTFETFDGKLDLIAVFERELTAAEVWEIANAAGLATRERFDVNGLATNDGVRFELEELQAPPPKKRPRWIGHPDSDGEVLVEESRWENRQFRAKIRVVQQETMDEALDRIGELVDALQGCERTEGGAETLWSPAGSSRTLVFYALSAEIEEMPITPTGELAGWFIEAPVVTITVTAKPFGYAAAEESTTAVTQALPQVTADIDDVGGDVAAEGRLVITDNATQDRRHVQWGLEKVKRAEALLIDSDSLTVSGFSGTQTTRTGAYDPNASGNNVIRASVIATAPVPVCGTGSQTHVGTFRMKARVYATQDDIRVRFTYRVGVGQTETGDWVTVPNSGSFYEVDLGPVTIEELPAGTHSWSGEIHAIAGETAGDIDVDYLLMYPTSGGYGKARSPLTSTPRVLDAHDDFAGGSGDLSGRTSTSGDTWATAGQAGDFQESGTAATRSTASAASLTQGRHATIGATLTDSETWADVSMQELGVEDQFALMAVLLRYTDASNFLALGLLRFATGGFGGFGGSGGPGHWGSYYVIKRVGGVESVIGGGEASTWLGAPDAVYRLHASATADGVWSLGIGSVVAPDAFGVISGYDADLVAGGALDDGKAGITDAATWTTGTYTRTFDNFASSAGGLSDPIIESGAFMEVRHDLVTRLNFVYGDSPYQGTGFWLPPGDSRLAVGARRADIDNYPSDNLTDSTTIRAYWRERFLAVPRS